MICYKEFEDWQIINRLVIEEKKYKKNYTPQGLAL